MYEFKCDWFFRTLTRQKSWWFGGKGANQGEISTVAHFICF